MTFFFLLNISKKFNKTLDSYIDIEARKITSYIVNKSLKEIGEINIADYIDTSNNGVSYNVSKINKFKSDFYQILQKNFSEVEHGEYNDYPTFIKYNKKKYKYIRTGYLCEININSLNNIYLLSNVGPNIPVKLSFLGDINVDIDTKIKDYGINNVIVQLFVIVEVNNQVSMPMSSMTHRLEVKELVSMNIIKGSIPNYYSNFS